MRPLGQEILHPHTKDYVARAVLLLTYPGTRASSDINRSVPSPVRTISWEPELSNYSPNLRSDSSVRSMEPFSNVYKASLTQKSGRNKEKCYTKVRIGLRG